MDAAISSSQRSLPLSNHTKLNTASDTSASHPAINRPDERIPSIPNEIWYLIRDEIAEVDSSELRDGHGIPDFTAWLRSLRLVSQTFDIIFTPLAFRTLTLNTSKIISRLPHRSAHLRRDMQKFENRLQRHTVAIETSVELSGPDVGYVILCLHYAASLLTLMWPMPKLSPRGYWQDPAMRKNEFAYLKSFLKYNDWCHISIVQGYFKVQSIDSYDPYLQHRRLDSTALSPVNVLDVACESGFLPIPASPINVLEVLHIQIPWEHSFRYIGLDANSGTLPPIRALILENYRWIRHDPRSPVTAPFDFSQLESITLHFVPLTMFCLTVSSIGLPLLKRLVIVDCSGQLDDDIPKIKGTTRDLLPNLTSLEELAISDDWMAYTNIYDLFSVRRTKIRTLRLNQSRHLGSYGGNESDQMSASELALICKACPELSLLMIDVDMEQYDYDMERPLAWRLLEAIAEFKNLENLTLEIHSHLGTSPKSKAITTSSLESEPGPMTCDYDPCFSAARLLIAGLHKQKIGKPLKFVQVWVRHTEPPKNWNPPKNWKPPLEAGRSSKDVARGFRSYDGGQPEEVILSRR